MFSTLLLLHMKQWSPSLWVLQLQTGVSFHWGLVLLFAADFLMPCLALQPCSTHFLLLTACWHLQSNYVCLSPECLQAPCFLASHGWLLLKRECCTHQQVLAASATNVASPSQPSSILPKSWHSLHYAGSHLHADSLSTSCPTGTGTWLSVGPKPPKHMGSLCSKWVQQRRCVCKTGTGFPHRKGSEAFRTGTSFSHPCGLNMFIQRCDKGLYQLFFSSL